MLRHRRRFVMLPRLFIVLLFSYRRCVVRGGSKMCGCAVDPVRQLWLCEKTPDWEKE